MGNSAVVDLGTFRLPSTQCPLGLRLRTMSDLNNIKKRILHEYTTTPFAEPAMRDAGDRIFIPYVLHDKLPQDAVDKLSEVINSEIEEMALHSFGMGIRALNMAGLRRPAGFRLPEHSFSENECLEFVRERNWEKSWGASIEILHMAQPHLLFNTLDADRFFEVLEQYQNEGGGWGNENLHRQMGTAFHFVPLYRAAEKQMPRLDKLAEYVLENEPVGPGYGAMDALYILKYAVEQNVIEKRTVDVSRYMTILCSGYEKNCHDYVASAQLLSLAAWFEGDESFRDGWAPELWGHC